MAPPSPLARRVAARAQPQWRASARANRGTVEVLRGLLRRVRPTSMPRAL